MLAAERFQPSEKEVDTKTQLTVHDFTVDPGPSNKSDNRKLAFLHGGIIIWFDLAFLLAQKIRRYLAEKTKQKKTAEGFGATTIFVVFLLRLLVSDSLGLCFNCIIQSRHFLSSA